MARFAPVVPVHMAEALQQEGGQDHLGRYHLLLAHDVLDKPDEYRRVFSRVRRDYPDSFIIMDNSIVELGAAMKLPDLMEACKIVSPDCLVIPDVMGEGEETRVMARLFAREYVREAYNHTDSPIPLMGVLQGSHEEDCMETCALYYTLPMVQYISVPRVITKMQGSRMPVMMALCERERYNLFDGVHLLGFSDDLLDDVACARLPFVQGIDSAVPIRAGLQGIVMDLGNEDQPSKIGPRGDFWDEPLSRRWKDSNVAVKYNLELIRKWIKSA